MSREGQGFALLVKSYSKTLLCWCVRVAPNSDGWVLPFGLTCLPGTNMLERPGTWRSSTGLTEDGRKSRLVISKCPFLLSTYQIRTKAFRSLLLSLSFAKQVLYIHNLAISCLLAKWLELIWAIRESCLIRKIHWHGAFSSSDSRTCTLTPTVTLGIKYKDI